MQSVVNHASYAPASASASDHIKTFTRLWRCFRINEPHELFKDQERRQAANTSSVKSKEAEVPAGHAVEDLRMQTSSHLELNTVCRVEPEEQNGVWAEWSLRLNGA